MVATVVVAQTWTITAANAVEFTAVQAWWAARRLLPDLAGATSVVSTQQRRITVTLPNNTFTQTDWPTVL